MEKRVHRGALVYVGQYVFIFGIFGKYLFLGVAIWSMHFVGMSAMRLHTLKGTPVIMTYTRSDLIFSWH